jgi:hypothetical protein
MTDIERALFRLEAVAISLKALSHPATLVHPNTPAQLEKESQRIQEVAKWLKQFTPSS